MKAITIILLLISTIAMPQCLNIDIMLVADYSGSVKGNEDFVSQAVNSLAEELILPAVNDVRLGVIVFDDDAEVMVKPDNDFLENLFHSGKDLMQRQGSGSTNIDLALQTATVELLASGQDGRRKLIILISDGDATVGSSEQTLATGRHIQALKIGICSILIKNASSRSEFMKEISSGCYVETDYMNLASELKKLNLCL